MGDGIRLATSASTTVDDFGPLIDFDAQSASLEEQNNMPTIEKQKEEWIKSFLLNERSNMGSGCRLDDGAPTSNSNNLEEMSIELGKFNQLIEKRQLFEAMLTDESINELRRMRRDYQNASREIDRHKLRLQINVAFPHLGAINRELMSQEARMIQLNTTETTVHHGASRALKSASGNRPSESVIVSYSVTRDPFSSERNALAGRIESFYKPREQDRFESVWQKVKDDSPIIKITEVLKHLPNIKISFDKPDDIAKMVMVMAGTAPDSQEMRLLTNAFDGVKSIEKKEGNTLFVAREGTRKIPPPQMINIGAGISVEAVEVSSISCKIGEGKNPSLKDIDGITIKLRVPSAIRNLAGVRSDVKVRKLELEADNSGGWKLVLTVDNPVAKLQRKAIAAIVSNVPKDDQVKVPIMMLDKSGNVAR
ncbi:MAG: hypothetical protein K2X93_00875 [Candidatus Obscuribacterales bacterium]|nr:hypothetical protein [Candidatus Obscuribacterales bacterium]